MAFQKAWIVLVLLVAIVDPGNCWGAPEGVLEKKVFDFGTVEEGKSVEAVFQIKNVGDSDLTVSRIIPSCGCLMPAIQYPVVPTPVGQPIPASLVPPPPSAPGIPLGLTAVVKATMNTSGFTGRVEHSIRVLTNDPKNPYLVLTLRGTVKSAVSLSPERVLFPDIINSVGSHSAATLTVTTSRPGRLTVESLSKFVAVREVMRTPSSVSFETRILPGVSVGEFRNRLLVSLHTDADTFFKTVPVFAVIKPTVQPSVTKLSFGRLNGNAPITKTFLLNYLGLADVQKSELIVNQSSRQGLKVAIRPVDPGKTWEISVTLDPEKVASRVREELTILLSDTEIAPAKIKITGSKGDSLS